MPWWAREVIRALNVPDVLEHKNMVMIRTKGLEVVMRNPQIISVHEYELKPGVQGAQFERAFQEAEVRGLFKLPGLLTCHFVKGIRGARKGKYAVLWVYESQEAWEQIWGAIDQPISKGEYPEKWSIWEDEILLNFLSQDPDRINFTSYLVLGHVPDPNEHRAK